MSVYKQFVRPALFCVDAEQAHGLSIAGLKTGLLPQISNQPSPALEQTLAGLTFPNPIGLAAGYDKHCEVPDALLRTGFGHVEIGTVTPKPQDGNPKPRLFRLPADEAVINRFGFNSEGHDVVYQRMLKRRHKGGLVGVNLGANKESTDFGADYVAGIHRFIGVASYLTINISSPNTPGLRSLQGADPLHDLLARIHDARLEAQDTNARVPIFLKIAPDLDEVELDAIAKAVSQSDLDGLIVSNTTLSRQGLKDQKKAAETGGLSGKPLFERSTIVLAKMYQRLGRDIPLIGVGGVHDVETAWQKLEAGARLVQVYSALVYEGPGLPRRLISGLQKKVQRDSLSDLSEIIGRNAVLWAKRSL